MAGDLGVTVPSLPAPLILRIPLACRHPPETSNIVAAERIVPRGLSGLDPILDRLQIHWLDGGMANDVDQLLRQHGVQVTAQRLAIMRALSDRPHSTADDLTDEVRAVIGSISRQAVYDTLSVLADKNLIRRIQPAGSPARYEDRVGDNHHHLICRGCNTMFDINCAVGATPCLTADDDHGFEIDEAEVVYWGRCPACRTNQLDSIHSA